MTSFMDTYLDSQSNFSNDINLYSEGFRFDEQDTDFIEGQIALREIPILLEKEEILSRMNLYAEAAGGVLVGILSFIKSAIALMIKIFLGFKGILIAVIVALIGRFIIKKFKGGSTSYSGGGGGSSSSGSGGSSHAASVSASSGVSALTRMNAENVLKRMNIPSVAARISQTLGLDAEGLMNRLKADREIQKQAEIIVERVLKDIRVEADNSNTSAIVFPGYIKPEFVVARLNKFLEIDQRVIDGTSYNDILSENPYYVFGDTKNTVNELNLTKFIVDCIRHYDGIVAAAYVSQLGALSAIHKAYSGATDEGQTQKDYFLAVIDEIRNEIPAETMRSIEGILSTLKSYNVVENVDKYFSPILKSIPNKVKPKSVKTYKNLAELLTNISKSIKPTKDVEDSQFKVKSLVFDNDNALCGVDYDGKAFEYNCAYEFSKEFESSQPNMNKLKGVLNKLDDLGKHIQKTINDVNFDGLQKNKGESLNVPNTKEVISIAVNMVSCGAQSVNIMSYILKNSTNPIHNAIVEDAVFIATMMYTEKELANI